MLSLKAKNSPVLHGTSLLNCGLIYFFTQNMEIQSAEFLSFLMDWKNTGLLAIGAAPIIGALSLMLPRATKEALVYWRLSNAAPGYRAFSEHARSDPRVDMERLIELLPELQNKHLSPKSQNKLWYRLFKQCEVSKIVDQSHRNWLLYRDLTALSFIFLLTFIALWLIKEPTINWKLYIGISFTQWVIFTFAARNVGTQFIRNVLAIMSLPDQSWKDSA